jgi:hypothetical protein
MHDPVDHELISRRLKQHSPVTDAQSPRRYMLHKPFHIARHVVAKQGEFILDPLRDVRRQTIQVT